MSSEESRDAIAHVRGSGGTLVLRSIGTLRPKPLAGALLVLFGLLCVAHPAYAQGSEPAVTVSFGQATYSVQENSTVDITVTLNQDPERQVAIPLSVTNQDGASAGGLLGRTRQRHLRERGKPPGPSPSLPPTTATMTTESPSR